MKLRMSTLSFAGVSAMALISMFSCRYTNRFRLDSSQLKPRYAPTLNGGGLSVASKKTYDVAANWKLLIENFLEYYHLPAVHPALCNVSGVDEHQRRQGRGMYMCFIAL